MTRTWISSLEANQTVEETFLVLRKSMPISPTNGRPYLSVLLGDRTGQLDARLWDNAPAANQRFEENDYLRVEGRVVLYQGRIQLHIGSLEPVDDGQVDPVDFLPESGIPAEQLWRETLEILGSVTSPHLRGLLEQILEDERFVAAYKRVPAGKSIHHARIGGLMEHNLSMCRIIDAIFGVYDQIMPGLIDRDLLITAGLLHDAGKTVELSAERKFDYTDAGRLLGHVVLGYELVSQHIARRPGFPEDLALHLKHLLLAHHGALEHGSPKRPKTIEAWILHFVDVMDCRVAQTMDLITDLPPRGWTPFQKLHDRYLWRGHSREGDASEDATAGDATAGDATAGDATAGDATAGDATAEET